uniref:PGG domain-containing protein n=1 Tax=Oryza meridionalis TaxID=40149 RepID=A0A0E0E7K5_9ORYZ
MVDGDAGRRAPAPATSPAAEEAEFLWELRKYVLLLATLAATVTYTAGLDPPGGFWTDNVGELLAGDPVLQKTYPRRYKAFFYCNATAFVASLVIVNLLLVRFLCRRRWWLRALQAAMTLDIPPLYSAAAAQMTTSTRRRLGSEPGAAAATSDRFAFSIIIFGIFDFVRSV